MKKLSCLGAGALVLAALILIPLAALLNGWILMVLWGWFVVPLFHLPSLTLFAAIGITLVVAFLTYQHVDVKSPERETSEAVAHAVSVTVARPLTYLVFGWIIHTLMVSNVLS